MTAVRTLGDKLETVVADDLWPLADVSGDAVYQVNQRAAHEVSVLF